MVYSKEVVVTDVVGLIAETQEVRQDFSWIFRGQSNVDWELIPKAGRSDFFIQNEELYFDSWKRRAIEFVDTLPVSNWDWLTVAQHHGFPTRLLDWSRNPLAAAFFSVCTDDDCDGEISVFRPTLKILRENVEPLEYDGLSVFRPTAFTGRISRQSGIFTVHGPADQAVHHDPENVGSLWRIILPKNCKKQIMRDLDSLGVHYSSMFPDLDGLSKHLSWLGNDKPMRSQILEEQMTVTIPHG